MSVTSGAGSSYWEEGHSSQGQIRVGKQERGLSLELATLLSPHIYCWLKWVTQLSPASTRWENIVEGTAKSCGKGVGARRAELQPATRQKPRFVLFPAGRNVILALASLLHWGGRALGGGNCSQQWLALISRHNFPSDSQTLVFDRIVDEISANTDPGSCFQIY